MRPDIDRTIQPLRLHIMKQMRAVTAGLLMVSQLIYSGIALSATGTIILRDQDNGQCSLSAPEPGKSIIYSFVNAPVPCQNWNKKSRTFQILNFPSASTIYITANRNCWNSEDQHDAPWFILRTINKLTTTVIIQIETLASFPPRKIITPGLQMVELYKRDDGMHRDQISCIRIDSSAAPPPPQ